MRSTGGAVMRLILLVLFLVFAGAIYTLAGNSLDEQQIRDFYQK
jgi:hypothetical protein